MNEGLIHRTSLFTNSKLTMDKKECVKDKYPNVTGEALRSKDDSSGLKQSKWRQLLLCNKTTNYLAVSTYNGTKEQTSKRARSRQDKQRCQTLFHEPWHLATQTTSDSGIATKKKRAAHTPTTEPTGQTTHASNKKPSVPSRKSWRLFDTIFGITLCKPMVLNSAFREGNPLKFFMFHNTNLWRHE